MSRPLDTALDHVGCRTLLWGFGIATGLAMVKTGLEAGGGGSWRWWLLLALVFGALWMVTRFMCGSDEAAQTHREHVGGDSRDETGQSAGTVVSAAATPNVAASHETPKRTGPHWARPTKTKTVATAPIATAAADGEAGNTSASGNEIGGKPAVLPAARDDAPDDLKQISGVGPKLENLLHDLGFYHFDQIAAWTTENVAWVDDHLGFKGRIDRDDWVGQAKKLAAGEMTEFAERVARGEVDSSTDDDA